MRNMFVISALFVLLCGLSSSAVGEDQIPVNRAKVKAALEQAKLNQADTVHYAVPAMSVIKRLADVYPEDGRLNGALRIVAAQDEFEPASFQLHSFGGQQNVVFDISNLRGPNGATMPASAIDLKVVKIWYQNGNAWTSYFSDEGLVLVPELLLKDENMVRVDTKDAANYARVKKPTGTQEVWISPPRRLETGTFRPMAEPFADAKALQPVQLEAGHFKQFFATLHVPEKQTPGIYEGTIVARSGRTVLTTIPVKVRVLPFKLPLPRPYYSLDEPFVVSMMCAPSLSSIAKAVDGDLKQAKKLYRKYLVNVRKHGLTHPFVDQTEEGLALMKELGFEMKPLIGELFAPWFGHGGRMTFDKLMVAKKCARKASEFYMKNVGHNDILAGHGDEQGAAFVAAYREFFKYYEHYGIKVGCSGHSGLFYKGGYAYGYYPMAGYPDDSKTIDRWRKVGDKYVAFYAGQHTGSENPQFIRRQHGMLGYLNNLNMTYNYEFGVGSWNDRAGGTYKPMVIAYMNRGGLVDTLQWEGFREGVDDMRYATKLKLLVREAAQSGDVERKLQGKKALHYMALLDGATMDLDTVRAEMITHILKLIAMRQN